MKKNNVLPKAEVPPLSPAAGLLFCYGNRLSRQYPPPR